MTASPDQEGYETERWTALRSLILSAPETVLEDPEVMSALLRLSEPSDRRVVDLRGAALARLETRLSRLQRVHRDMIEAAFDGITGVEQTHGAVLALLEAGGDSLAARVRGRLTALLGLDEARLCLCLDDTPAAPFASPLRSAPTARTRRGRLAQGLERLARRLGLPPRRASLTLRELESDAEFDQFDPALVLLPREALEARRPALPRRPASGCGDPPVAMRLRSVEPGDRAFFGAAADRLTAVAVIALDLGPGREPGALVFGASDPERFRSGQAVELLSFMGAVMERLIAAEDAAWPGAVA